MIQGDRADGLSELRVGNAGRLILSAHPAALADCTPEQAVRHYAGLGAHTLLTLLTSQEIEILGLQQLGALCACHGLRWLHAPIEDHQAPDPGFESWWGQQAGGLHRQIDEGVAVAIHCWGGKGRTGTIAARLLIERGLAPEAAIAAVRQCRPGAIETNAQVDYLLRLNPQRRS